MATATKPAGVEVYWTDPAREADDLFVSAPAPTFSGVLTTAHAASCNGAPVLVADDGTVMGPADLPAGAVLRDTRSCFHHIDATAGDVDFCRKLHAAGPDTLAATPEMLAMYRDVLRGAVAAGFRLAGINT